MLGLAGFGLGVAGSFLNMFFTWQVLELFKKSAEAAPPPRMGAILTVLAFLIKLPLFVACGLLARHLGGGAVPCFLGGVALVYFCAVGWALARR